MKRAMGARGTAIRPPGGHAVAIGLGSNLGDRLAHLRFGVERLRRVLEGLRCSSVFETDPRGYLEQPAFLNACCVGRTNLTARQLLSELQDAERAAGREGGGIRHGPRTLDLDLLLYGDLCLDTPELQLPHPRIRDRAFVLAPLAEVAPEWELPAQEGQERASVGDLARVADRSGITRTELEL